MFLRIGDNVTRTRNHWADRTEWAGGRRQWSFHVVFDGTGLAEATRDVRAAVASVIALDPVPPGWLHLTMTTLGFTDEVDADAAGAVAENAFAALPQGGDLTFDTVLIGAEGPLLCPQPADWLAEAVRTQREAVDQRLGAREWRPFFPHVSLAYAKAVVPVEHVAEAVGPSAEAAPPITVRPTMALVEQAIVDRTYRWRVVRHAAS